eukprot:5024437-Prymnesium_polylepis.1
MISPPLPTPIAFSWPPAIATAVLAFATAPLTAPLAASSGDGIPGSIEPSRGRSARMRTKGRHTRGRA